MNITLPPVMPDDLYVVLLHKPNGKILMLVKEVEPGRYAARTFMFGKDAEAYRERPEDEISKVAVTEVEQAVLRLQETGEDVVGYVIDPDATIYKV